MAFSDHMKVLLGVDSKGFQTGLSKAEKRAKGFGDMMKSKVLPLLGAAAFAKTAESVINFGAKIGDLSTRLGVNAEFLQKFQYAAEQSGVKSDAAGIALQRFARRSAEAREKGGELKLELDKLGISLTTSGGQAKSTEALFSEFGEKLRGINDPAEKLRVAFKFLDTEGVALTQMFQKGGKSMQEFGNEAESLGLVMKEDTIKSLQDADATLQQTGRQFKVMLANALKPLSTGLENATGVVRTLMNVIGNFSGVIKAGTAAVVSYVVAVKTIRAAAAATAAIQGLTAAAGACSRSLKLLRIATVALAFGNFSKAAKAATLAMRAFTLAVAANPVGLLVAGITAVATGFVLLGNRADAAKKKMQELEAAGMARVKKALQDLDKAAQNTRLEIIELQKELDRLQGKKVDFKDFTLDEQLQMAKEEGKKLNREMDGMVTGLKTQKKELQEEIEMQKQLLQLKKDRGDRLLDLQNKQEDIKILENQMLDLDKQILQKNIEIEQNLDKQEGIQAEIKNNQDLREAGLQDILDGITEEEKALKRTKEQIDAFNKGGKEALENVKERHEFEDKVAELVKDGKMAAEDALKLAKDRQDADKALENINNNIKNNIVDQKTAKQQLANIDMTQQLVAENQLHQQAKQAFQDQLDILNLQAQGRDREAQKLQNKINFQNDINDIVDQQGIKEGQAIRLIGKKLQLEKDIKQKKIDQKIQEKENIGVRKQAIREIGDATDKEDRKRIRAAKRVEHLDKEILKLRERGDDRAQREIEKLESIKTREMEIILDDATKEDLSDLREQKIEVQSTFDTQIEALRERLNEVEQAEKDANKNRQDAAEEAKKQAADAQKAVNDAAAEGIEQAGKAGAELVKGIGDATDAGATAITKAGNAVVAAIKGIQPAGGGQGTVGGGQSTSIDTSQGGQGDNKPANPSQLHAKLVEDLENFAGSLGEQLGKMQVDMQPPKIPYQIQNDITINFDSDDIATETTLQEVAGILDGKFVNQ